ncbi:MAG TPA: HEAT repeat domain-containing protein [Opitutaceae bacterium]|nr:HEAT repeat domain-containing protein [Opitutaceae bacterium]
MPHLVFSRPVPIAFLKSAGQARKFTCSLLGSVIVGVSLSHAVPADNNPLTPPAPISLGESLGPLVESASPLAEQSLLTLRLPSGLKADLWAAEPLLGDPVALSFDRRGRLYVSEHHRNRHGTEDTREHRYWLEDDLAARTVDDRLAYMKRWAAQGKTPLSFYTEVPDRLICLEDRDGDGRADTTRVLAHYADPLDGANVGVLATDDDVWVTCIPHLWKFHDAGGNGPLTGEPAFSGFGVKFSFHGHDMHGVIQGPDGRIYWSIGDRGYHVRDQAGKIHEDAWGGAVFRCEPDGSGFEVVCTGLRNPQELVFDPLGNLFTVDNDNDAADESPRLLHLVEGADYGWHAGNLWVDDQLSPLAPRFRRPWYEDGLWQSRFPGQPAWVMPPIDHLSSGPCGLTRNPGVTRLPDEWDNTFFLTDWVGGRNNSPVLSFQLESHGNGFSMTKKREFLVGGLPTDVEFGPDGRLYVADMTSWVQAPGGGRRSGRGWIYAISGEVSETRSQAVRAVQTWLAQDPHARPDSELLIALAHDDYRVRLAAQRALASRRSTTGALIETARNHRNQLARVHALQALGQQLRAQQTGLEKLLLLLQDPDPEIRAQYARQLTERPAPFARSALLASLEDDSPRVRYFSALALSRLANDPDILNALARLVRENDDRDVYLRHAVAVAWERFAQKSGEDFLRTLAKDSSSAVRRAALLAYRRLRSPEISVFLVDRDPSLVAEAVRAIHDLPIVAALPGLAALSASLDQLDPATGRRVVNARYRLGRDEDAQALADVGTNPAVSEILRRESLALLAEWTQPRPMERITGRWDPLLARSDTAAVAATRRLLPALLANSPDGVKATAIGLAGRYHINEAAAPVLAVARDSRQPLDSRVAAAQALVFFPSQETEHLATQLLGEDKPELRSAGRALFLATAPEKGLEAMHHVFTTTTLPEQSAALKTLGGVSDPRAYTLLTTTYERMLAGEVTKALAVDLDDALKSAATLNGLSVPDRNRRGRQHAALQEKWLAQFPSDDSLRLYRASLQGGDAQKGRELFHQKVEFLCVRCHRIENEGTSVVGPDLTGIASRRSREELLRAIVEPSAEIAPGFEFATVILTTGETLTGPVHRESATDLVLGVSQDGTERERTLLKSAIRERSASSSMPPLASLMTPSELRDLVAYLAGQNTPSPVTAPTRF